MSLFRSSLTWLRLTMRWSNSAQTWHERVADGFLAGGLLLLIALTWFFSWPWWLVGLGAGSLLFSALPGRAGLLAVFLFLAVAALAIALGFKVWPLAACAACLLPSVVLNRTGWLKVFGPVLYFDMVRTARQNRFLLFRFLYSLLLLALLINTAFFLRPGQFLPRNVFQAAEVAQNYFELFMVAQFLTVVLLTPAYVAAAVADEKDRKTLEFMLATDLLNREIVLSKLGSRLANLFLIVLTGLPILSILQFSGGIDPNLVVAGFVLTIMTIAGLGGVSILCSVICKRPRDAIGLAYLGIIVYYGLSLALMVAMATVAGLSTTAVWFGQDPLVAHDLVDLYNKGSLITVIRDVKIAGAAGTLGTDLPPLVRDYAIFHGALFLACTSLAVARVRRVALAHMDGQPASARAAGGMFARPQVGDNPMLWKELHCEGGPRMNWIALLIFSILVAGTLIPAVRIISDHWEQFDEPPTYRNELVIRMNVWGRVCNVVVGCLTLLSVAVRASTSITRERDKQTMDALLTSPLDSSTILHAKWLGSILSVRLGVVWLGAIWAVGVVTGGLHWVAVGAVATAWLVFAAFVATLGMWFSVVCKTSMRATVLTILSTIGLGVGHWLIWLCCGYALFANPGMGRTGEHVAKLHLGLTPPFVMGFAHMSTHELEDYGMRHSHREFTEMAGYSMLGLLLWMVATAVLYGAASVRFRKVTNRTDRMELDGALAQLSPAGRPPWWGPPIAPWAPPSGAVTLEEVEDNTTEPLDHDADTGRYRPR
jgi:ABC-type transport system involved in multi-copper enzyme maturation permease subunit